MNECRRNYIEHFFVFLLELRQKNGLRKVPEA